MIIGCAASARTKASYKTTEFFAYLGQSGRRLSRRVDRWSPE
jgi:hypothetical protein